MLAQMMTDQAKANEITDLDQVKPSRAPSLEEVTLTSHLFFS